MSADADTDVAARGPVPALAERAAACADRLRASDRVLLASHIDADGLTSAAVASRALERAGITFETVFEKQLDRNAIERIARTILDKLAATEPETLALMHGSAFRGDGGKLLRALGDALFV